ncbi:MAG: hypothetical protein JSV32_00735 [Dehalococcoidia bacterium]|nr:MAG: hypothetical protein JSV32_00735 [Dehalococcoidia bacterium]
MTKKVQPPRKGCLELVAFILGILGLIGLTVGYLIVAFGYSSGLMGFFATLTIIGFILIIGRQILRRVTGSLLMLIVGVLGFNTLNFVPEISREMLGTIGVAVLINIPATVYILSGILYFAVMYKESDSF